MTTLSNPRLILVRPVTPRTPQGREECLRRGTPPVLSRPCRTCGQIGHPIVKSFEPGEDRPRYCIGQSYL